MSHKKTISAIIEEKKLCSSAIEKFNGKSLEEIANNPDCGMNWVATFASSIVGEYDWLTKKQLISKALIEVLLYKNDYSDPQETWIQPTLDAIQAWLDNEKTDDEINNIGKINFDKVRVYDKRTKEIEYSKAVATLSCCPKNIKRLSIVYEYLSNAIHFDSNINKNKKDALNDMVTRFDIESTICNETKEQIE